MLFVKKKKNRTDKIILTTVALCWSIFQLLLPRFIILDSTATRAIHLAFAIMLGFFYLPFRKQDEEKFPFLHSLHHIPFIDLALGIVGSLSALYLTINIKQISMRAGNPIMLDIVVGVVLILILLEVARRVIGLSLPLIAIIISLYAFGGEIIPIRMLALKAVSLSKFVSQITLSTEGIYGIPLDVSANTVFLFVLLGAMFEKVGAGHFFTNLSISLMGRFRGGSAKASVVSSGLTGLISGSSIANVVTTGTFTIPLMKKTGYPAKLAAATEVAASTNGQLMPPIMGAAAFIIAEYLGISYIAVIKAAVIPAFVSYFALFYITHLEALKHNIFGLNKSEVPSFVATLKSGFHFLIPLFILFYELIFLRHSPKFAAFNAIVMLTLVTLVQQLINCKKQKKRVLDGIVKTIILTRDGLINGAKNMMTVALATATAGIVVGVINLGIGNNITSVVHTLSMGNLFFLLLITAIVSLIIGMGLPTTATYIVMASVTVPIIAKFSDSATSIIIPLIGAHLFCFYFGILADDTPPVGLAAYSAAAIAHSDPISTGIQGFIYDLRTAVIPFMFVLNPEILLFGMQTAPQIILIILTTTLGVFAFTNAVQGWTLYKNSWYDLPLLLLSSLLFLYPSVLTKATQINKLNPATFSLSEYIEFADKYVDKKGVLSPYFLVDAQRSYFTLQEYSKSKYDRLVKRGTIKDVLFEFPSISLTQKALDRLTEQQVSPEILQKLKDEIGVIYKDEQSFIAKINSIIANDQNLLATIQKYSRYDISIIQKALSDAPQVVDDRNLDVFVEVDNITDEVVEQVGDEAAYELLERADIYKNLVYFLALGLYLFVLFFQKVKARFASLD